MVSNHGAITVAIIFFLGVLIMIIAFPLILYFALRENKKRKKEGN